MLWDVNEKKTSIYRLFICEKDQNHNCSIFLNIIVTESMATWTLSPAIDTLLCFITLFLFFVLFSLSVAIYSHVCVLFHQSIDSRASLSVTIIKHDLKRVLK